MRERILPFTFQRQMPITGGTASRRVLVRVPLTMKLAGILAATFAIGLAAAAEGAQAPSKKAPSARAGANDRVAVRLLDLASLRRIFTVMARQRQAMNEGERVGAWTDFTVMAAAVVGD